MVRPLDPQYRKSVKSETCALSRQSRLQHFFGFIWIVSQKWSPPRHRPRGIRRRHRTTDTCRPYHMYAMSAPDPPRPPRLVGGVLRTGQLPYDIIGDLSDRFRVTREEEGALSSEIRSGRGIHVFPGKLASGVDPALGMDCLAILGFDRYRTVRVFHSLFYVPAGYYYM